MRDTTAPVGDDVAAGMNRRTILAGAAWSVPVIAVATASPAFAATNDLTLAFDKATYSGDSCGTITGATVKATKNGAAAAGESITVTLPSGWSFADGSTSVTKVSGADGTISIPDIKVPGGNRSDTITATSGSASTSSALKSTDSKAGAYVLADGTTSEYLKVPTTATALGARFFYDSGSKKIYYGNAEVATGVSSAFGYSQPSRGSDLASYVDSKGGHILQGSSIVANYDKVPTSATALGARYYYDSGTQKLYYGNTEVATGVKSAYGYGDMKNAKDMVTYVDASGGHVLKNGAKDADYTSVPTGATALGGRYFYDASSKSIYYGNTVVATGVSSASGYSDYEGNDFVTYVDSSGGHVYQGSSKKDDYTSVPTSATALGNRYFFDADKGVVYYGNTSKTSGLKVLSAFGYTDSSGDLDDVAYVAVTKCA